MPRLTACPKCRAKVGERHEEMCDWARCKYTGIQQIQCGWTHDHRCVPHRFDGTFPGEHLAEELGMFSKFEGYGKGWVACDRDTPGAMPDLNAAVLVGRWDPDAEDIVRRVDTDTEGETH